MSPLDQSSRPIARTRSAVETTLGEKSDLGKWESLKIVLADADAPAGRWALPLADAPQARPDQLRHLVGEAVGKVTLEEFVERYQQLHRSR